MLYSRDEVFRQIENSQRELREFGVEQLQLFGSAVRDESSAASDLDFVVHLSQTSFRAYMGVKLFLEDLFRCHVDLVLADSIKPRFRDTILQEAVQAPGF